MGQRVATDLQEGGGDTALVSFPYPVKLPQSHVSVGSRHVALASGFAATAAIKSDDRRIFELLLSPLLLAASLIAGCTSIFNVRIPLSAATHSPPAAVQNVVIKDQRPLSERKVHTGGGLGRCERWYGDDTYVPSKLEYLQQLLAQRIPGDATASVTLQRFDTVEYCDNTANRAGAAAAGASGATGTPVYIPAQEIPGGDSVLVRLAGEINGVPFDLSRRFDYADLRYNTLTEMPGDNPRYRERMTSAMEEIAGELVALAGMGKER